MKNKSLFIIAHDPIEQVKDLYEAVTKKEGAVRYLNIILYHKFIILFLRVLIITTKMHKNIEKKKKLK